jgi:hypothetical protein
MKKLIAIALLASSSASFALTDGQAALIGIIVGSQINKTTAYQYQPQSFDSLKYYRNVPSPIISSATDVCSGISDSIELAYCRGAAQRAEIERRRAEQEAYNRGLNGR